MTSTYTRTKRSNSIGSKAKSNHWVCCRFQGENPKHSSTLVANDIKSNAILSMRLICILPRCLENFTFKSVLFIVIAPLTLPFSMFTFGLNSFSEKLTLGYYRSCVHTLPCFFTAEGCPCGVVLSAPPSDDMSDGQLGVGGRGMRLVQK